MNKHPSFARLILAAGALSPPITGPAALAKSLGEGAATVTNWGARGVSKGGATNAQKVLGISSTWILDGVEPMLVGDPRPAVSRIAEIATAAVDSFRIDLIAGEADMGDGRINEDFPEVIRAVEFPPDYIRSVVGFLPPPGRLVLVTGRGDSMVPVIEPGDSVIVDTGCQSYEGDGLYLINSGHGQQIKLLHDRGDAVYVVSANVLYPPFPIPTGAVIGGKVYLRNRVERMN